ncbi:MAG: polysaccharide deacetylase family protein [Gemmatales bacterium]
MSRHPILQTMRQWGIAAVRSGIEHSPWRNRILFRLPASAEKRIALTFDDGPDLDCTPFLLDELAHYQWHATFFLVGQRAEAHPALVQRILREGHSIGNHTYSHVNPAKLSLSAFQEELQRTDDVFCAAIPEYTARWFRPPWGQLTRDQRIQALHAGRRIVYWSFTTHDYAVSPETILASAIAVKPRDIFLLHDRNASTRTSVPKLFEQLQEAGFKSVSLDEIGHW